MILEAGEVGLWPAPAKLNLFLHVLGRRADGRHALQTVFQLLDWGDTLELRVRSDGHIQRRGAVAGVPEADDLTLRAAHRLQRESGCALGAEIALTKHIPLGGGLGGGSSDAATVLVALNRLWGLDWPKARLATLGLTLGADVPVFVHGYSAWAEGVGEVLTPMDLPEAWFVVLHPGVAVSTAEVFADPQLTRSSVPITMSGFRSGVDTRNDLQPVVCRRYPAVAEALAWLNRFSPARMTGSGSCLFCVAADAQQAARIARECPTPWRAYAVKGVARSALLARAQAV